MRLLLKDRTARLCEAWNEAFAGDPSVSVTCGDIFEGPDVDAIISPANSFGFMDGGIDLVYSQHFGWDLEKRLQARLKADFFGELPVGQAVLVETLNAGIPWLVSAPTMRVPGNVSDTPNAYLALRAALVAVKAHNASTSGKPIETILCPGLASAIGGMPAPRVAAQMRLAWRVVTGLQAWPPARPGLIHDSHWQLTQA